MRNGQAWPNSGGSTMVGKSGVRVSVRSTILIWPETSSAMNWVRTLLVMVSPGLQKLALEPFGVVSQAGKEFFGDVADIDVLGAFLQGPHDGRGYRGRRNARRGRQLFPLVVDRPGKYVDDADARLQEFVAQALCDR